MTPDRTATMAAKLWPDSPYLQREWLRAVEVVRATKHGWVLDNPKPKRARNA